MITLAELAKNADDKLVQGFVNEVITDSALLDSLQFDNCVEAGARPSSTATSASPAASPPHSANSTPSPRHPTSPSSA